MVRGGRINEEDEFERGDGIEDENDDDYDDDDDDDGNDGDNDDEEEDALAKDRSVGQMDY